LALGALALSACGGSSGGGSSSGGGKKTYTIAYQGPLSGDNAQLGINMDNGVKLAVEQANKKGDLPFTLNFTDSDDVGDPAQAPAAARKLIDNKDVVEHNITLTEGKRLLVEAGPKKSVTATVTLAAGTYEFFCSVPGHNMKATLTVQ